MKKPVLVICLILAAAAVSLSAQLSRPKATVTPLVERPAAQAGGAVRLALKVSLPEGLHTQSNRPLDPTLIPTVLPGKLAGQGLVSRARFGEYHHSGSFLVQTVNDGQI